MNIEIKIIGDAIQPGLPVEVKSVQMAQKLGDK